MSQNQEKQKAILTKVFILKKSRKDHQSCSSCRSARNFWLRSHLPATVSSSFQQQFLAASSINFQQLPASIFDRLLFGYYGFLNAFIHRYPICWNKAGLHEVILGTSAAKNAHYPSTESSLCK
ncbi:unnamed protein product [Prunus armeniaca]|uniref:Uncharacterized protein n=1 Tax=Prunus armeniaca TaxID=36596 RepID=A0A6J5WH62_PRUAR|nr:unnamed protein product [Prunus armeniaca]CAB4299227.1 unnamed protein product [Prunus armeniaca]